MHNRTPMLLSLIGGILLIVSSASGAIGVNGELADALMSTVGTDAVLLFESIVQTLAVLTSVCGVGIVIGGLIVTTHRVSTGRRVIQITTSLGVLGLSISLAQQLMVGAIMMSLILQIAQSIGWLGAIFGLISQIIAEQQPLTAPE